MAACVLYPETLRTCTYQYVLLRVFMYIYGLRTSTYIYKHMYIYVCLRLTTSVYKRSRTTFIYVSIRSNMQICWTTTTMTYYVRCAYTNLLGSLSIYTYNICIHLPINTYQYGYIRVVRIYVQIQKYIPKYIQKYVQ